MVARYVPDKGEIVWLDFDPQSGKEIMKRRPALVVTPKLYNQASGLCVVCPISSKTKGHLFEFPVVVAGTKGVIKTDQVKSLDWQRRNVKFITKAPKSTLLAVQEKLATLLFE